MTAHESAIETLEVVVTDPATDVGTPYGSVRLVPQSAQLKNPDARIILAVLSVGGKLSLHAEASHGVGTFDSPRFCACCWEVTFNPTGWIPQQSTPDRTQAYGGCNFALRWEQGKGSLAAMMSAKEDDGYTSGKWKAGVSEWGKSGIIAGQMNDLPCTLYAGYAFDENASVIVPHLPADSAAVWCYCASPAFKQAIRAIDDSIKVTCKSLVKVPFDHGHWQKVAAEKYPNGLPEPQSDDPTQWLFHGHPAGRVPLTGDPNPHLNAVLQVAIARVVGYRWTAELDAKMRLAPEARAWVDKCKMLEKFADDDGVVPLVPINKEQPGAERVRALLEAAFGAKWTPGLLYDLLAAAGSPGKSLDEWLKHEFFAQHCALFQNRPFIWQIWDGKKDGFNILVHYHRLAEGDGKGKRLLEKIVYTYLGDWITQQQAAAKSGEPGADLRLKAAHDLQKRLEAIITGEPPYDIFVRWKPLHEQPVGWDPDINDGVRMNIRPFVTAGVLRGKVNVKWTKDRGKEPESIRPKAQFPWFWSCPEDEPPTDFPGGAKFTGERFNDLHYTNETKQAAREKSEQGSKNQPKRK